MDNNVLPFRRKAPAAVPHRVPPPPPAQRRMNSGAADMADLKRGIQELAEEVMAVSKYLRILVREMRKQAARDARNTRKV